MSDPLFLGAWHLLGALRQAFGMPFSAARAHRHHLEVLARELQLTVVDGGLEGSREQVHIAIEVISREVGAFSEHADASGRAQRRHIAAIRLLDPKGPPGLDLGLERLVDQLTSGPDLLLGDPAFDEVVRVTAADPALTVSLLDAPLRQRLVTHLRRGWVRRNAEWTRVEVTADVLRLQEELELGVGICLALRRSRPVGVLLEERLRDPVQGVRDTALGLLLDRGWLDEPGLLVAMDSPRLDLATRAALELGPVGRRWLEEGLVHPTRERRLRAAAALAHQMPERAEVLEPILLAGLRTDLAPQCIDALAHVGGAATLAALEGRADGAETVQTLLARRSRREGELSVADLAGGDLSVAEPDSG